MAINVIEDAERVEISCDGCGRVIHTLELGQYEENTYESPLEKIGNHTYCELCAPNHRSRVEAENQTYEAKHRQLRETVTDSDELEDALKALDEEYGIKGQA